MKKIVALAVSTQLFLTGCSVFCPVTPEVAEVPAYKDYRPVDPTPVAMANLYIEDGKIKSVPWSLMTNTQIRSLLPNQKSYVSVAKVDKSGKLSYLTSRSTLEAGRYRLYSDYFKYKVEEMVKDGQVVGSGFVGIGVRLQVDVRTLKADVDLSSVAAVGVAAKEGKLQGDISVSVIGIDTNDADLAFNSGSVDDASIQKALETLGAIKSRMKDVNTILTPQIVYVKDLKDM